MKAFKKRIIHLHHCRGINSKDIIKIIQSDPTLKNLYKTPPSKLKSIINSSPEHFSKFYYDLHHLKIDQILSTYQKHHIYCLTVFDPDYPYLLKQCYNPPLALYVIGNVSLLNSPCVAIVGSRKGNIYGRKAIEQILPTLIKKKITIISGLAKGIDTMAHEMTILHGGKTICVLGSGFFHIYPQENRRLAENMKKEHLLLSEYPPNTKPQRWHFPMRNRIISGLSKGIVVIQAEEKSGSLITADFALQENREVFAIPGSVVDPLSKGTNFLIQQGAKLVLTGDDILEEIY
ncbi:DNA-protecting protein DprA [Heyndrickxia oleronia]|uniref:DNA-processing protein DprA n=1 Tax=Heyndrickxia oleronia TaxID=38875 RepID=UPI0033368D4C